MDIILNNVTDIIVALIGAYFLYSSKKSDARAEERKTESYLSMKMANANMELTLCLARNMLSGDTTICDVQKATDKAEEAQKEYEQFLEKLKAERFF